MAKSTFAKTLERDTQEQASPFFAQKCVKDPAIFRGFPQDEYSVTILAHHPWNQWSNDPILCLHLFCQGGGY